MKYQKRLENNKTKCLICPRECALKEGQEGFCHVRKNKGGEIVSTTYGYNTGLSIDPIEKKPLYHFFPNSKILSFGTLGCPMGCLFCQNFSSSKSKADPLAFNKTSPGEIVQIAKKYNVGAVAFTYNDPITFFEYATDTAKLCKEAGIKTVAVTSGFMNIEPACEFFNLTDAANIDLKGFTEEFYRKNCLAKLGPVLEVIKFVKQETDCHLELTTMIIEGENDSKEEIQREADWILNTLGDRVPLHFSAFFPKYKFKNRPETKFKTLLKAREIALQAGLKYVYTGNLANMETSSTKCFNCGEPVILRAGYNRVENRLQSGFCPTCGAKIDGRF